MDKASYDEYPIAVNFKNDLSLNETVQSYTVTCVDSEGNDSSASIIAADSLATPKVNISIKGGAHGEKHKITVSGVTAFGDVLEKEIWITINNYMIDGTFHMQPNEIVLFACDFMNHLSSGDTIAANTATVTRTSDESDVSATSLIGTSQDGTKILAKIANLEADEIYRVTVRIETTNGEKYQMNITVFVQEL